MKKPFHILLIFGLLTIKPLSAGSLIDNSPFIPPGWKPPSGKNDTSDERHEAQSPQLPSTLEYKGVADRNGVKTFYIYDRQKQRGSWVGIQNPQADYFIEGYDEQNDSLTLKIQGQAEVITFKKSDGQPIPVATAPISPTQTVNQPSSVNQRRTLDARRRAIPRRRRSVRRTVPTPSRSINPTASQMDPSAQQENRAINTEPPDRAQEETR